ncbi:hypothetical protein, partial [uncultured Clostridium sp.]|uniref:hypothetical protein n=1 Tax=uncultured Clostridium sp. TaxID=59620 RepID=UPI0025D8F85C
MDKKVDKGFQLIYWKLSYRRKFIRTLWLIPFSVVALILIWELISNIIFNTIVTVSLISTNLIQLIYTYKILIIKSLGALKIACGVGNSFNIAMELLE